MRTSLVLVVLLAACSNAANPAVDAAFVPIDGSTDTGGEVTGPDAAPSGALHFLVVNEVAAGETPDWIEIVNATFSPVELSDFVYVDVAGDFTKAVPFPSMMLSPGAYYVQSVDDATSGFKLSADEEVWVYRASDHALSDGIDWAAGDSPTGSSYGRSPTIFGSFVTGAQSKGSANP